MSLLYFISRIVQFLMFKGLKLSDPKHINHFAIIGVVFAWIAGVGRYWDHPSAHVWQYLGLGSVIYVFFLSFILWGIVYPIRRGPWSYKAVLTFVALTSPLAWLYAIPVERFLPVETAIQVNVWFLAIVALWRVGLLFHFLKTYGRLSKQVVVLITLLPLTLIITALAVLNLEQAIFEVMAGIGDERSGTQKIHDKVYEWVLMMSIMSFLLFPVLAISYILLIVRTYKQKKNRNL